MKRQIWCVCLVVFASVLLCAPVLAAQSDVVVGTVETLIRENTGYGSCIEETALGNVTADAMRTVSGVDVAIVNGGELICNLQAGQRTRSDIEMIFQENRPLSTARITAAQLWNILEHGVSHIVLGENQKVVTEQSQFKGFPQVSGLWFQYDRSAPVGQRIMKVELLDGRVLLEDDEETYITICATKYMLSGGYGYDQIEYDDLNMGLVDALEQYMGVVVISEPDSDRRIRPVGSSDEPLVSRGTALLVAFAACVIGCCVFIVKEKLKQNNDLFL